MHKTQRVKNALTGQPVDYVPASFWFHFPPEATAGHAMARAHLDYYRVVDLDYLKVMNDNGYSLAGVERIATPTDWKRLRPAPLTDRPFQNQLDGLKEILEEVGEEVPVITTLFNPFSTAADNRTGRQDYSVDPNFNQITAEIRSHPEALISAFSAIAETLAEFARACIVAGAAGIFYAVHGGERGRFTQEEFSEWIEPYDRVVLGAAEEAGGWFNQLHICGEKLRLESYRTYPAHAFNWAVQRGNLSLSAGRTLFGKVVSGGMDERGPLISGPQDAIVREIKAVMNEMGSTGWMLGAGCTLPGDVPRGNLSIALNSRKD